MGAEVEASRGKFGRYALGPVLGSGGMATVRFGAATGALGFARPVAIKRIHATRASDAELLQAIRDEARIASRVRHPNVVSVIDVIEENGDVGIVLEYVHGEALSSLLRSARASNKEVPVGVAVAVVVDVLHGLHAAHTAHDEAGRPLEIVHRDVSPQNVIVGADGVARVLDFGISKAENRASVTRDGRVKGKLRYMAPEQLGGAVTPAADVYAAGIVLWELLAGRSPFEDVNNEGELLARVLAGISIAPSTYATVPGALDAITARALAGPPLARWATAAQMAEALEQAGPVASRTTVSAWVAELAGEVLEARSRVVAAMDRGTAIATQTSVLTTPIASEAGTGTDATSGRDALLLAALQASQRRTRLVPWLLALALAAVAAWFALASRPPSPVALRDSTPVPAVSPAPTPPSTAGRDSAAVVPSLPAPGVPSAATTAPARKRPPGTLRKQRPEAPAACNPPFDIDANGDRQYRRECFE